MRYLSRLVVAVLTLTVAGVSSAFASEKVATEVALDEAHRLFYSGRYDAAAAMALSARQSDPLNLLVIELRSSALHFQIRRTFGSPDDRGLAWKECPACQELMTAFLAETNLGRNIARERLRVNPLDDEALFFLGKLNLNYVWLQLSTLGRRAGWSEYWEARKSLDELLERNPGHVRARVARAWVDYIVATKVPRGVRWMVGGGNRKRGLETVRDASQADAPPIVQAEAMFALWEMLQRERNMPEAVVTARALSLEFPENKDLAKFLSENDLQRRQ